MRSARSLLIAPLGALLVSGCLAKTAFDVVTLPVKVAGAGLDAVTTSQAEADQKRGRAIRQREERLGQLEREHRRLAGKCANGDRKACDRADRMRSEIDASLPGARYERRN